MEKIIVIGIYIHALLGGIGLLAGMLSILTQKGGKFHKISGKFFAIGMLGSCMLSLIIACMPGHKNLFLFLIGVFTIYMVVTGVRSLRYKSKKIMLATRFDRIVSLLMFLSSLFMVGLGIYQTIIFESTSVLLLVFGGFGILLTRGDFKFFKDVRKQKNGWLRNHISKIVGAYIASVTAFIVAGLGINHLAAWVIPSILGTIFIVYWIKKVKRPMQQST